MSPLTQPPKILELSVVQFNRDPPKATHPQSDMPFLVTLALARLEVWMPTDFGSKT